MSRVFADTSFYVAMLNTADAFHQKADAYAMDYRGEIITTEYVVVELGNWLARAATRDRFPGFVQGLFDDPLTTVIPAERLLLRTAIGLYAERPDKDWSLTDCISFVVMDQWRINEALATDHHFQQAGFRALLRE